jgi:predicted ABC-type ATPase
MVGALFCAENAEFFNPDEAAQRLRALQPELSSKEANAHAWAMGKHLLERAIAERKNYAFETTLGGDTITALLLKALNADIEVRVSYVGLKSPEQHIERVGRRVARGGHDIAGDRIRQRYDSSRLNLIRQLPKLTELRLFDNSEEADPYSGQTPEPLLVLHLGRGRVLEMCDPNMVPEWAKPIVSAALKLR